MQNAWDLYPELIRIVNKDQQKQAAVAGGHDIIHALVVAQYCLLIQPDQEIAQIGCAAGVCHNWDRMYPGASEAERESALRHYFDQGTDLSSDAKNKGVEAVLHHSYMNDLIKNKTPCTDSPVTVTLKDGDRLANIGAQVIPRAAQLFARLYPERDYPVVDLVHWDSDPEATFKDPRSIYRNFIHALEWEPWLRLPEAKRLARPYFDFLRTFLRLIEDQFAEAGFVPLPQKLQDLGVLPE